MATCSMYAIYSGNLSRSVAATDPDLNEPSRLVPDPSAQSSTDPAAPNPNHAGGATSSNAVPYDPTRLARLSVNLKRYEDNFSRHLRILLDAMRYYAHTETSGLLDLCARLSLAGEGTGTNPSARPSSRFFALDDMGGGGIG